MLLRSIPGSDTFVAHELKCGERSFVISGFVVFI